MRAYVTSFQMKRERVHLICQGSVSEKQVRDALKKDGTTDNLLEKLLQKGKK